MTPPIIEWLKSVQQYLSLAPAKELELQDIVQTAARICQTPIALITFVDKQHHYIKFRIGIDIEEFIIEGSFCNYTMQQAGVMIVEDALADERFVEYPLVTGAPFIRFFAGTCLINAEGNKIGTLSVVDIKPNSLNKLQTETLQILAHQIINILEFNSALQIIKEQYLEAKNSENKLRSFFESTGSCHLLIGKDHKVLAFNKAIAKFIKHIFNIELVVGIETPQLIHEPNRSYYLENHEKALRGETTRVERLIDYGTEMIWWDISYEPAMNEAGEIIGISFNATDITAKKEHESKVTTQDEALRNIAFLHSHELRKPVASIMGLMNIFKDENYRASKEELMMLETVANELDEKIRTIVGYTG